MTAITRKFRLPRKTVFLVGGILLLGGATGACALYMSREGLLGDSSDPKVSALACTTVKTFKIRNKDRYWVRKFIKTDPADGLARVATALRVAEAVYEAEKPDLVQVVVLDQRGPEQRANMRGRAVGADVVYVPHPEKSPDLAGTPVYSAKYVDGAANEAGQFYGEKIQLPPEHIESLVSLLPDHADCVDPAAESEKAKDAKGGAHGEKATEHGAESASPEAAVTEPEAPPPVYEEPSAEEAPVAEAPAEPQAEHEAATPSPAVSDEQTSAAAQAHEAPAPASGGHGETVSPEHGASASAGVAAPQEPAGQDYYDEPSVNGQ